MVWSTTYFSWQISLIPSPLTIPVLHGSPVNTVMKPHVGKASSIGSTSKEPAHRQSTAGSWCHTSIKCNKCEASDFLGPRYKCGLVALPYLQTLHSKYLNTNIVLCLSAGCVTITISVAPVCGYYQTLTVTTLVTYS